MRYEPLVYNSMPCHSIPCSVCFRLMLMILVCRHKFFLTKSFFSLAFTEKLVICLTKWGADKELHHFQLPLIGSLLIGMGRRGSDLFFHNPVSFPQPVEEGNLSVTSGCWPRPPGALIIPPRCHNLWSGWREWWGQLTLQQQTLTTSVAASVAGSEGPSHLGGSVFLTLQLQQLKGQEDGEPETLVKGAPANTLGLTHSSAEWRDFFLIESVFQVHW